MTTDEMLSQLQHRFYRAREYRGRAPVIHKLSIQANEIVPKVMMDVTFGGPDRHRVIEAAHRLLCGEGESAVVAHERRRRDEEAGR